MQSVPHDPPSDPPAEARGDVAEQDGTARDHPIGARPGSQDGSPAAGGDDRGGRGNGGDEDIERQMRTSDKQSDGTATPDPAPAEPAGDASNGTGAPGETTAPGAPAAASGHEPGAPEGTEAGAAGGADGPDVEGGTRSPAGAGDAAETTEMPRVDVPDPDAPARSGGPAPAGPPEPPSSPPAAPPTAPPPPSGPTFTVRSAGTPAPRPDDATGGAYRDTAPSSPPPSPPPTVPTPTAEPPIRPGDGPAGQPGDQPRHLRAGPARPGRPSRPGRPARPGQAEDEESARQERQRRILTLVALAPVVLLILLLVAWAVDAAALSGQVVRNVEVAGRPVGGVGEASLPEVVSDVAADVAERPVVIQVAGQTQGFRPTGTAQPRTYETTAEALGLTLDQQATADAALDVGRDDPIFVRPFKWAASFFSTREVPLQYRMSESHTAATLQLLQGDQREHPTEPTIQLTEDGFVPVEGQPGTGLNPAQVSEDLLAAADTSNQGRITIDAELTDIEPYFSQADVEALANRANELTADGLRLVAGEATVDVPAEQLRQWITPTEIDEGGERRLDLAFNTQAAQEAIPGMFDELSAEPRNATITLQNGRPTVTPGANGVRCCGEQAGARLWEALQAGRTELELEVEVTEPEHTTQEVEGWRISQPVGGARAHRNGADVPGPGPGFTTYFDCCQPRVTNIQRIAQLVDGAVIAPGESFSLNDHVGQRTTANGFVPAGAIRDGMHVDEVGGGVSQFFTTLFNAAFFAGLDIDEYQAHSENFPRYPDGREATGGYPAPDLVIENDSPHGVLIDTSYTDSSVTVTLWSTQHATAEQTGISSSPQGNCTRVTVTRTRTFPDGRTEDDTFTATYRPGEGQFC